MLKVLKCETGLCLVLRVADSSRHSVQQMYADQQNIHLQDFRKVRLIGKMLSKVL